MAENTVLNADNRTGSRNGSCHLLRHGETVGFVQQCLHGRSDIALTEEGQMQMQASVAGQQWGLIISSPLQRCAGFAKALANEQGIECQIWSDLQEYDFGAWEGQPVEQLCAQYGEQYLNFFRNPAKYPAPMAEPYADFEARVAAAWQALQALTRPDKPILVVSHGGPIRLMLGVAMQIDAAKALALKVPHASLSAIYWQADGACRVQHKPTEAV